MKAPSTEKKEESHALSSFSGNIALSYLFPVTKRYEKILAESGQCFYNN
jgi:hypothetical protein